MLEVSHLNLPGDSTLAGVVAMLQPLSLMGEIDMRDQSIGGLALLVPVLAFAIAIVQVAGFLEGLNHLWGWSLWLAIPAWVLCAMLGPLGAVGMLIFTFIGAKDGWGWAWWQALLLAAPYLIIQLFAAGTAGTIGLFGTLGHRRRPVF